MEVNWFTVVAQIINFLVLVWLMKKYLYKPILDAIDEREKKIAAELADARNKMVEAKKERDDFQKKNEVFDDHKKEMMDQAASDAAEERRKLLDLAQKEAATAKQKMEDASRDLQENLNEQFAEKTQQQVFSIAKKALAELASTTLEQQSVQVFIGKINSLAGKDKKEFIDAFHSDSNPVLINSAFELSEKEQKSIEIAIADLLGENGDYEFKSNSKMISGIELATNGYKLSWSFSAYIDSLEKSMASPIDKTHKTEKDS